MTRPEITISELADTMLSNLPVVTEANATILNAEVAHQLQVKLSPLADILELFNRKRSSGKGDTKVFLKFMIAESYKLGAAMFLKATQYMVAKALVSNPDKFVSKIKVNGLLDTAFQSDPKWDPPLKVVILCFNTNHPGNSSKVTNRSAQFSRICIQHHCKS